MVSSGIRHLKDGLRDLLKLICLYKKQRSNFECTLWLGILHKEIYLSLNLPLMCCSAADFKTWGKKSMRSNKQEAVKAVSARQQWRNSRPTKLKNERLNTLYSSLLPVYIIPALSHQGAWMKSFHQLSVENLASSLKFNTVAQHACRCSTFTE